jgi:Hemerythrin HHE cation binding domain
MEACMTAATAPLPLQRFSATFREEHRIVRDLLLELLQAFEARDLTRVRALLGETATVTGPHFRYEEESLYPALVPIFGAEYVDKLLADHDLAIASARRLVELARQEALTDAEATQAVRLVRGILPHVSDCEGLTIMVELLPDAAVESILETRDRARDEGLDLLTWAAQVRPRPGIGR